MESFIQDLQFLLSRHELRLENPSGLWLLCAIPVLAVVGLWMSPDLRWWRKIPIQLLRASLVALLAIALAQPVKVSTSSAPALVLLADRSSSLSPEAQASLEERVRRIWEERGEAPTWLVGFGRTPALLSSPGEEPVFPEASGVDGTDLQAALRFAYGLLPVGRDRRVLLLSDGEETQGDLVAEAGRARALGVEVSTAPFLSEVAFDARVERLAVPPSVRMGERGQATAEIFASSKHTLHLVLTRGREVVSDQAVALAQGQNTVALDFTLPVEGWHRIAVQIRAQGDRTPGNNRAEAAVFALGRPRILLVQQSEAQNPLRRVIQEMDVGLEVVLPGAFPADLAALAKQDLVVLDDLKLAALPRETMEQLRTYVEEQGGGLLLTVGRDGAELANPEELPLEALLPIELRQVKKKEQIPAALVFVTDRSSSMGRGAKFEVLLRAVGDTLDRLKDQAQVSIIMFDDFPEVVVPLTEARRREEIKRALFAQRVGGGTSIFPGLEEAEKQLKKSAAKLKHIILLSDGQSISLLDHYAYVIDKLVRDNVTVSAVALGEDADQNELRRIAERANGRFYYTSTMDNVPKIFLSETEQIKETNEVEQPVRPVPAKLVEALAGLDFATAPAFLGYVPSEARPTSEVLLQSADRGEPLLARWRFGLGRVMVWTTDAIGAWGSNFAGWSSFAALWPRLVRDTLRRTPPGDLRLQIERSGEVAIAAVRVPGARPQSDLPPPRLYARDPSGREREIALVRRGIERFEARIPLPEQGPLALWAERMSRYKTREVTYGSVSRAFSDEYLSAGGNPDLLRRAANAGGGTFDPSNFDLLQPGRERRESTSPRWPPFVLWALGLFLVEVFVRRVL